MELLKKAKIMALLPRRGRDANKGSFGSVAAVAGSLCYRGAAALCVEGALRCGAGLVFLASVEPVLQLTLGRTPECCAIPCQCNEATGGITVQDAAALCRRFAAKPAVLLAGPGLGEGADALLPTLLAGPWQGAVLDADALNALAGLPKTQTPALPPCTVLTPHPGEMARLLGCTVAEVQANREKAVRLCAQRFGCVAVLKGSGTLIATPQGQLYKNTTGNPGLARGGSGDVLAGMLAALLAQGLPARDAALCAVYLHGAAADLCAEKTCELTMLPHDLFAALPEVLR